MWLSVGQLSRHVTLTLTICDSVSIDFCDRVTLTARDQASVDHVTMHPQFPWLETSNNITHEAQLGHRHDVFQLVLNLLDKLAHLEGQLHLQVYDRSVGGRVRFVSTFLPTSSLLLLLWRSTVFRAGIGQSRRLESGSEKQNQNIHCKKKHLSLEWRVRTTLAKSSKWNSKNWKGDITFANLCCQCAAKWSQLFDFCCFSCGIRCSLVASQSKIKHKLKSTMASINSFVKVVQQTTTSSEQRISCNKQCKSATEMRKFLLFFFPAVI